MEHEDDSDTSSNWSDLNGPQRPVYRMGGEELEIRRSRNNPNYSIVKISQNTEKSPGDLRRLAVTQSPVKNHQLILE